MSVSNDRGYPDTELPTMAFFRNDLVRHCWANEQELFLLVFHIAPFLSTVRLPIRSLTRQQLF